MASGLWGLGVGSRVLGAVREMGVSARGQAVLLYAAFVIFRC